MKKANGLCPSKHCTDLGRTIRVPEFKTEITMWDESLVIFRITTKLNPFRRFILWLIGWKVRDL